ncbi:MAG: hypothetical protein MHPSP_002139 [Paramarteilia canceri]
MISTRLSFMRNNGLKVSIVWIVLEIIHINGSCSQNSIKQEMNTAVSSVYSSTFGYHLPLYCLNLRVEANKLSSVTCKESMLWPISRVSQTDYCNIFFEIKNENFLADQSISKIVQLLEEISIHFFSHFCYYSTSYQNFVIIQDVIHFHNWMDTESHFKNGAMPGALQRSDGQPSAFEVIILKMAQKLRIDQNNSTNCIKSQINEKLSQFKKSFQYLMSKIVAHHDEEASLSKTINSKIIDNEIIELLTYTDPKIDLSPIKSETLSHLAIEVENELRQNIKYNIINNNRFDIFHKNFSKPIGCMILLENIELNLLLERTTSTDISEEDWRDISESRKNLYDLVSSFYRENTIDNEEPIYNRLNLFLTSVANNLNSITINSENKSLKKALNCSKYILLELFEVLVKYSTKNVQFGDKLEDIKEKYENFKSSLILVYSDTEYSDWVEKSLECIAILLFNSNFSY